jgi:hypothetical protein
MTPTQDSLPSRPKPGPRRLYRPPRARYHPTSARWAVVSMGAGIGVSVRWLLKERQNGLWVPVRAFHNLVTNYGLTAMAAAPAGAYTPPIYLVIDTAYTTMYSQANAGTSTVQLAADPTVAGDTQLVLSVGLASQETVTFTGKSGTNPVVFTLSANLVNTHSTGDPVVRAVTANDTMASVLSEAQYDPTNNPNKRSALTSNYSPGNAQSTMQFFLSGQTATNLFFAHVGLADNSTIGAPNTNLHNYAALGYNHNNTNDLEIDVTYTLQTF